MATISTSEHTAPIGVFTSSQPSLVQCVPVPPISLTSDRSIHDWPEAFAVLKELAPLASADVIITDMGPANEMLREIVAFLVQEFHRTLEAGQRWEEGRYGA